MSSELSFNQIAKELDAQVCSPDIGQTTRRAPGRTSESLGSEY
jgi:hypothetical protein